MRERGIMAFVRSTSSAQEAMDQLHHLHGQDVEAMEFQSPNHQCHGQEEEAVEFQSPDHHGNCQVEVAMKFRSPNLQPHGHTREIFFQSSNHLLHGHGQEENIEFQSPNYHRHGQESMEFQTRNHHGHGQEATEFQSSNCHHHEFQSSTNHRHSQQAMMFPTPNNHLRHGPLVKDHNLMWRPGSSAYRGTSPGREQMDRLRCQQELQKLYEETSENSYDLSLKDIVDPGYSISGNLKAIIAEEANLKAQVREVNGTRNRKGSSMPKLSFSFSFPGLRGKRNNSSSSHDGFSAWKASPSLEVKDKWASTPKSSRNAKLCSSPETQRSSMSRIHPFNHCSACSAYTIFFKCHCLVCGRLYCNSCAKERMDELLKGRKCKEACQSGALRKRLSRNVRSRCWPFCSSSDVQMLQLYSSTENHV